MKTWIILCVVAFLLPLIIQSEGHLSKRFHPFLTAKRVAHHLKRHIGAIRRDHVARRDADVDSCVSAISDSSSERYMNCYNEIESFEEGDQISTSDVETFCSNNCGNFIADVSYRVVEYCPGGDIDDIDQNALAILKATCDEDPVHDYCLSDWLDTSSLSDDYYDCLDDNHDRCTDACSKATTYIVKNLGCCYSYLSLLNEESNLLPESAFTACKFDFPKHC